jgi:hypothetical protein
MICNTTLGGLPLRDKAARGEIVIATILSFRSKSKLSKQEIKQEIVRKARYALKRAAVAT